MFGEGLILAVKKIAVMLSSKSIRRSARFFGGVEGSDINPVAVCIPASCAPFAVCERRDVFDSGSAVRPASRVVHVFRTRTDTKVTAPIVQAVMIDMIDFDVWFVANTQKVAMQKESPLEWKIGLLSFAKSVIRRSLFPIRRALPRMFHQGVVIAEINDREAFKRKRNKSTPNAINFDVLLFCASRVSRAMTLHVSTWLSFKDSLFGVGVSGDAGRLPASAMA